MAGLIETEMDKQPKLEPGKVAMPGSTGFEAEQHQVDAGKETVSGQLDKVLAKDSPVLQRARSKSMEYANSRGLINSSMAAQAGEAAVIDAATPIAAADANVFNTSARENVAAKNAALSQTAQAKNASKLAGAAALNDQAMQTLRGEQAKGLAEIEANYKTLIQSSDSASKMFTMAQQTIAAIQADPNTSAEQKQKAIDSASNVLKAGLTLSGSIANIDLAGLLDFTV